MSLHFKYWFGLTSPFLLGLIFCLEKDQLNKEFLILASGSVEMYTFQDKHYLYHTWKKIIKVNL